MAALHAKQSYSLMDAKGQVARVVLALNYDGAEAAPDAWTVGSGMAAAIAGASNAFLFAASGPYGYLVPKQYGARADYVDAEDKAVLTFQDNVGALHRFSIPAPKAALFMADGQTVSPTSALVEAFITALITPANSASFGGRASTFSQAPAGFIAGQRQRRRTSRRLTLWTLSGGLDEPAE